MAFCSAVSDRRPEHRRIPRIPVTVVNASPRGQRAWTAHLLAINRTASRADRGHDVVAVMSTTTEPSDCDWDGLCKAENPKPGIYHVPENGLDPPIVVGGNRPSPAAYVMQFTPALVEGRRNAE